MLGELFERRRGNPVKERVLAHDRSHSRSSAIGDIRYYVTVFRTE